MKSIILRPAAAQQTTEYLLGHGILATIPRLGHRTVVIADSHILDLYGKKLAKQLDAEIFSFEAGEAAKTRETKQKLENELLDKKYGRDTTIIAVGGGVTTDLVGFLAATYLRGVPFISVPTTLLGMVDAAIGGKTGVDTPHGKNLIGATYFPKAIFADLDVLQTLPLKEKINGFAEILKSALIADASLWACSEKNMEELVWKAAQVKIHVVEKDPYETGLRRILNFGHTVGHALETAAHYALAHGEAVAIGCVAESFLSCRLGYLSEAELEEIQLRFQKTGFALKLPKSYRRDAFFQAMESDKKKAGGQIRFTLLETIGKALTFDGNYCRPVPPEKLVEMAEWMERKYG